MLREDIINTSGFSVDTKNLKILLDRIDKIDTYEKDMLIPKTINVRELVDNKDEHEFTYVDVMLLWELLKKASKETKMILKLDQDELEDEKNYVVYKNTERLFILTDTPIEEDNTKKITTQKELEDYVHSSHNVKAKDGEKISFHISHRDGVATVEVYNTNTPEEV